MEGSRLDAEAPEPPFPPCAPRHWQPDSDPPGGRQGTGEISGASDGPKIKKLKGAPPAMKEAGKPHPHPQATQENPILELEGPAKYPSGRKAFHMEDTKQANRRKL